MQTTLEFLEAQVKALQKENKRLNDELRKVKRIKLTDPNFDKPLKDFFRETN